MLMILANQKEDRQSRKPPKIESKHMWSLRRARKMFAHGVRLFFSFTSYLVAKVVDVFFNRSPVREVMEIQGQCWVVSTQVKTVPYLAIIMFDFLYCCLLLLPRPRDTELYYIDTYEIPGFFPLLKKKIRSSSSVMKILFLSFTCEDIVVVIATKIITQ